MSDNITMTREEIVEFLRDELIECRKNWLKTLTADRADERDSKAAIYSYVAMICNDIGIKDLV